MINDITAVTTFLVAHGFADDQNYPVRRPLHDGLVEVQYGPPDSLRAAALADQPYADMYAEQRAARAFNVQMLDGALIQMFYEFSRRDLRRARLAFLPSPDLSPFQSDPELYTQDVMYAEVVDQRVVTVPMRFDVDNRPGAARNVEHPQAHLTLGQYQNCRIPTSAPLTPGAFVGFLLRNFYYTATSATAAQSPIHDHRFTATITDAERSLLHLTIP